MLTNNLTALFDDHIASYALREITHPPRGKDGLFVQPDDASADREKNEAHNRERFANHFHYADPIAGNARTYDPKGNYNCGRCNMAVGNKCLLVVPLTIDRTAGSCGEWENLDAGDPEMPLGEKTIETAGYGIAANGKGFGCHRCPYASKAHEPDSQGRDLYCGKGDFRVFENACCALNGAETLKMDEEGRPKGEGETAEYAEADAELRRSIAEAAKETDTEPTHRQAEAGNYPKGVFMLHGLRVVIENPAGSKRRGIGEDGQPWERKITCPYGYLSAWKRHGVQKSAADGDNLDVFIGPDPESELVFVIDQHRRNGQFDEHKMVMGTHSETEARELYLSNYPAGWGGLKAITAMTLPEFREWLEKGDTRRPVAQYQLAREFDDLMAQYAGQKSFNWNEADHPRGQPENAGEFVKKSEQVQKPADRQGLDKLKARLAKYLTPEQLQKIEGLSPLQIANKADAMARLAGTKDEEFGRLAEEIKGWKPEEKPVAGGSTASAHEGIAPAAEPAATLPLNDEPDIDTEANSKPDPIEDENPREAARTRLKAEADAMYAFARKSTVRNAGEDLWGSARHKRNWGGLADAEANGTAEELVTRDNLLKNEPHAIMAKLDDDNALCGLAMHLALQKFPPAPFNPTQSRGYYAKQSEETKKAYRQSYVEAYQKIKAKAEELALRPNPEFLPAMQELSKTIAQEMNDIRGLRRSYDPVANGLAKMHNDVAVSRYSQSGPKHAGQQVLDFGNRLKEKYGEEWLKHAAKHAGDVLEGDSFNKTFGTKAEPREKKDFNPASLYVTVANREGGRPVPREIKAGTKFVMDDLKMRGLQWGNYVSDDERKEHLTHVAGAFADMADMLGLRPEDMSLDGKLGLAIGARGHSNALAHYEPDSKVINLTRKSGVGTVAHEWGHFFDHHMAGGTVSGGHGDYQSQHTSDTRIVKDEKGRHKVENGKLVTEDLSKEPMHAAYSALRQAMRDSGFKKRMGETLTTLRHNGMTDKKADYWRSDEEVFARSFERYVQHKLKEEGRENTYLSGFGTETHWSSDPNQKLGAALWPNYDEIAHMAPHFDKIFEVYRQKKYGTTDVQQYSRAAFIQAFIDDAMEEYVAQYGQGSLWSEEQHPRGQPENAGEFRKKEEAAGPKKPSRKPAAAQEQLFATSDQPGLFGKQPPKVASLTPAKRERELSVQDMSYKEQERIYSEVTADPTKASQRDLTIAYGYMQSLIGHENRRHERGDSTKQQRDFMVDGLKQEGEFWNGLIKDYVNGRKTPPAEDMSRAEKIAEQVVLDGKKVHAVADEMGLSRQELDYIMPEVDKAIDEHRQIEKELGKIPSAARAKAMARQRQLQTESPADSLTVKQPAPLEGQKALTELFEKAIEQHKPKLPHEMTREEHSRAIASAPSNTLATTTVEDWGRLPRGQGKRRGGMVMGGMASVPTGKKTYHNIVGKLPEHEKHDVAGLSDLEQLGYAKARGAGFDHEHALDVAFEFGDKEQFNAHQIAVRRAIEAGHHVPEHIKNEYPDLTAQMSLTSTLDAAFAQYASGLSFSPDVMRASLERLKSRRRPEEESRGAEQGLAKVGPPASGAQGLAQAKTSNPPINTSNPQETRASSAQATPKAHDGGSSKDRWVTIGSVNHHGGTPVKIDEKGQIEAGPANLKGKDVDHLPAREFPEHKGANEPHQPIEEEKPKYHPLPGWEEFRKGQSDQQEGEKTQPGEVPATAPGQTGGQQDRKSSATGESTAKGTPLEVTFKGGRWTAQATHKGKFIYRTDENREAAVRKATGDIEAAGGSVANGEQPAGETRWHVTPHHEAIGKEGFKSGSGGGVGGPVSGQGVSVWKDEKSADQFHKQTQQLEDIRTSADPLAEAQKATGQPLSVTDSTARLMEKHLGHKLTDAQRGVLHAQAINSPYIPATSFFGNEPKRDWKKLAVTVRPGAKSQVSNDSEELHRPEDVSAQAPPPAAAATPEALNAGASSSKEPESKRPGITYHNPDDKESDDRYFAKETAKAHKELADAHKALAEAKESHAEHQEKITKLTSDLEAYQKHIADLKAELEAGKAKRKSLEAKAEPTNPQAERRAKGIAKAGATKGSNKEDLNVYRIADAHGIPPAELRDAVEREMAIDSEHWDMLKDIVGNNRLTPAQRKQLREGDETSVKGMSDFDEMRAHAEQAGLDWEDVKDALKHGMPPRPSLADEEYVTKVARNMPEPEHRGKEVPVHAENDNVPFSESARGGLVAQYARRFDELIARYGGHGSGNFDHKGRPGKVGGSAADASKPESLDPYNSVRDFAKIITGLADKSPPEDRHYDNKALIEPLWRASQREETFPFMSLADFKDRLLAANRAGLIHLSRVDLTPKGREQVTKDSEIRISGESEYVPSATFHTVLIEGAKTAQYARQFDEAIARYCATSA